MSLCLQSGQDQRYAMGKDSVEMGESTSDLHNNHQNLSTAICHCQSWLSLLMWSKTMNRTHNDVWRIIRMMDLSLHHWIPGLCISWAQF